MVAVCWGSYGPTLHKGQAAMHEQPAAAAAVRGPGLFRHRRDRAAFILTASPEASRFSHFSGTCGACWPAPPAPSAPWGSSWRSTSAASRCSSCRWSSAAPQSSPRWSRPPAKGLLGQLGPMFLAGLILVIAGAAMVLVFAPKGRPHAAPIRRPRRRCQPHPKPPMLNRSGRPSSRP